MEIMKQFITNILDWITLVGEFSIEHPFMTVVLFVALMSLFICIIVLFYGVIYHPGAIVIGIIAGLSIAIVSLIKN